MSDHGENCRCNLCAFARETGAPMLPPIVTPEELRATSEAAIAAIYHSPRLPQMLQIPAMEQTPSLEQRIAALASEAELKVKSVEPIRGFELDAVEEMKQAASMALRAYRASEKLREVEKICGGVEEHPKRVALLMQAEALIEEAS